MDNLSEILSVTKVKSSLYFRTAFTAPWGVTVPSFNHVARFHYVSKGQCWVRVDGDSDPQCLEQGDLVVVPLGRAHTLSDTPDRKPTALDRLVEEAKYEGDGCLVYGGPETQAPTALICGHFEYADEILNPLLRQLPPAIVLRRSMIGDVQWLDEGLLFLSKEIDGDRPGRDALVQRISEILLIQVLRQYLEHAPEGSTPVSALRDPRLARALEVMHHRPEDRWTVASLAAEAGMSRTAFAGRFQQLMGLAPLEYLTDWRLRKATKLLRETGSPVRVIAYQCGYESEAAFARAFKKRFGVSPGEYRRTHLPARQH